MAKTAIPKPTASMILAWIRLWSGRVYAAKWDPDQPLNLICHLMSLCIRRANSLALRLQEASVSYPGATLLTSQPDNLNMVFDYRCIHCIYRPPASLVKIFFVVPEH